MTTQELLEIIAELEADLVTLRAAVRPKAQDIHEAESAILLARYWITKNKV